MNWYAFFGTCANHVAGDGNTVVDDENLIEVDQRDFCHRLLLACYAQTPLVFAQEHTAAFYYEFHRLPLYT